MLGMTQSTYYKKYQQDANRESGCWGKAKTVYLVTWKQSDSALISHRHEWEQSDSSWLLVSQPEAYKISLKLSEILCICFNFIKRPLWKFHCCAGISTGRTSRNNGSKYSFFLFIFLSTSLRSIIPSLFLIVIVTHTPFLKLSARQIPWYHMDSHNIWQLAPWQHDCWLCTFSCTAQSKSLDTGSHGSSLCASWGQAEPRDIPKMKALAQTQCSEPKLSIIYMLDTLCKESRSPLSISEAGTAEAVKML